MQKIITLFFFLSSYAIAGHSGEIYTYGYFQYVQETLIALSSVVANGNDYLENYIDEIFSKLKSNFGNILKSAKRVIFSGGGAYILKNSMEEFPANVFFDDGDFEFGNVRGYYNA